MVLAILARILLELNSIKCGLFVVVVVVVVVFIIIIMFSLSEINECVEGSPCEQRCTNKIGSYVCSCNSGYTLSSNGFSCISELNLGESVREQLFH